jgi:hypothetical protein
MTDKLFSVTVPRSGIIQLFTKPSTFSAHLRKVVLHKGYLAIRPEIMKAVRARPRAQMDS